MKKDNGWFGVDPKAEVLGGMDYGFSEVGKSRILEKEYSVKIWNENGWWIARVATENESVAVTHGRTREELWRMIADAVNTSEEQPVSWWNRIVSKLFIYEI